MEKIGKVIRRLAERADAVGRGERGDRHQNAGGTIHVRSAFHGAGRDALDDVFLAAEVEDDDGNDAQEDERHRRAVRGRAAAIHLVGEEKATDAQGTRAAVGHSLPEGCASTRRRGVCD